MYDDTHGSTGYETDDTIDYDEDAQTICDPRCHTVDSSDGNNYDIDSYEVDEPFVPDIPDSYQSYNDYEDPSSSDSITTGIVAAVGLGGFIAIIVAIHRKCCK